MSAARREKDVPGFYRAVLGAARLIIGRAIDEDRSEAGTDTLVADLEAMPDEGSIDEQDRERLKKLLTLADRRRFAPSEPQEWELDEAESVIRNLAGPPPPGGATDDNGAKPTNSD